MRRFPRTSPYWHIWPRPEDIDRPYVERQATPDRFQLDGMDPRLQASHRRIVNWVEERFPVFDQLGRVYITATYGNSFWAPAATTQWREPDTPATFNPATLYQSNRVQTSGLEMRAEALEEDIRSGFTHDRPTQRSHPYVSVMLHEALHPPVEQALTLFWDTQSIVREVLSETLGVPFHEEQYSRDVAKAIRTQLGDYAAFRYRKNVTKTANTGIAVPNRNGKIPGPKPNDDRLYGPREPDDRAGKYRFDVFEIVTCALTQAIEQGDDAAPAARGMHWLFDRYFSNESPGFDRAVEKLAERLWDAQRSGDPDAWKYASSPSNRLELGIRDDFDDVKTQRLLQRAIDPNHSPNPMDLSRERHAALYPDTGDGHVRRRYVDLPYVVLPLSAARERTASQLDVQGPAFRPMTKVDARLSPQQLSEQRAAAGLPRTAFPERPPAESANESSKEPATNASATATPTATPTPPVNEATASSNTTNTQATSDPPAPRATTAVAEPAPPATPDSQMRSGTRVRGPANSADSDGQQGTPMAPRRRWHGNGPPSGLPPMHVSPEPMTRQPRPGPRAGGPEL